MWEILMESLLFALKTGVVLIAIIIVIVVISGFVNRQQWEDIGQIRVRILNEVYKSYSEALESAGMDNKAWKNLLKLRERDERDQRTKDKERKKLYVIDFDGDITASDVTNLREKVSTVLRVAQQDDQVLVRLDSSGGTVHGYGLAASQLSRIRDRKIHLTIAVDKVAASGGYMMACLADKLIAAPFAIIGSIGVMQMMPNVHRLLKEHKVDFLEMTAGEYKRTVSPMGEITEKGMKKAQEELEATHRLFKEHISEFRPGLDIDKIATGETWYGREALMLNLIDMLQTSDDFIMARLEDTLVLLVDYQAPQSIRDKVAGMIGQASENVMNKIWQKIGTTSKQHQ